MCGRSISTRTNGSRRKIPTPGGRGNSRAEGSLTQSSRGLKTPPAGREAEKKSRAWGLCGTQGRELSSKTARPSELDKVVTGTPNEVPDQVGVTEMTAGTEVSWRLSGSSCLAQTWSGQRKKRLSGHGVLRAQFQLLEKSVRMIVRESSPRSVLGLVAGLVANPREQVPVPHWALFARSPGEGRLSL